MRARRSRGLLGAVLVLAVVLQPLAGFAAAPPARTPSPPTDGGWPRQFSSGDTALTVYQPQLDSWDGRRLQAHAAVSVRPQGATDSTFGVIWISARTGVDKENRLVDLEDIELPKASFPSAPGSESAYLDMFRRELPKRSRTIALDRLEASLAILEERRKAWTLPLRNDPPRILFSKVPAILVSVDGAPVYRAIPGIPRPLRCRASTARRSPRARSDRGRRPGSIRHGDRIYGRRCCGAYGSRATCRARLSATASSRW